MSKQSEVLKLNAAWARVNLQMPAGEYYALAPIEFEGIFQQWKLLRRRQDADVAKLCWVVATSAGCKLPDPNNPQPKDLFAIPYDYYMPGYKPKRKRVKRFDPIAVLIKSFPNQIIDNRVKK